MFSAKDLESPVTAPKSLALFAVEGLTDNKPSEHEAAAATAAIASPEPATPSGSTDGPPYTEAEYKALSDLIEATPLAEMDLKFLNDVYGRPHAPDMLKTIMGRSGMEQKNRRLGNLRKWYDWFENQAKFARDNHVIIENTNQGKDNGARSDLDATANILEFDWATGKWVIREKSVSELIRHQHKVYQDSQLTPDGLDVTIFNGDTWLPDWRDSRMSYAEFTQKLIVGTYDLKNRKGAYFVPGAHKEQAHDRALAEGHSVHIAWDYIKDMPTVNGHLVEFDYQKGEIVDAETKEPIQEYVTREMAEMGVIRRYENVRALEKPEAWRRALGNVIQNTKEFLGHDEPISRNKYFIERGVDQASGRFVGSSAVEALGSMTSLRENTYVSIHGSNIDGQVKEAWKKAFIQQAFGLADSQGERIAKIQSVLDRSSEIQLDKTKKWHDGHGADYTQRRAEYYAGEMAEAKQNIAKQRDAIQQLHDAKNKQLLAQEKPPLAEIDWNERTLKEAERIFVEKQREIMIDGGVRVVEETLRRDFSAEGAQLTKGSSGTPVGQQASTAPIARPASKNLPGQPGQGITGLTEQPKPTAHPPVTGTEPAMGSPAGERPRIEEPLTETAYHGPSSGVINWSGKVQQDGLIAIEGLPGIPVMIDFDAKEYAVVEPPWPSNKWKRLVLRSRRRKDAVISVRWTAIQ